MKLILYRKGTLDKRDVRFYRTKDKMTLFFDLLGGIRERWRDGWMYVEMGMPDVKEVNDTLSTDTGGSSEQVEDERVLVLKTLRQGE